MSGIPSTNIGKDCSEFVEVDPTGRYGRYKEILGKGASKIVYKAFDEYQGIEVAWNQVKLFDFLQSPEDLERLYCEIHLLRTLKHKNIMKYYTSWVDTANRNINFVTEMFTSGTLKQYREKHKRVNIRAIKNWCRQILQGLLYLHSLDPPVIHRDLKCDNIFVNGNHGEVKIGDLGLAAILRKSHAAHCVGTPEFMAPEVYAEEYNQLVDIYSFGMCVLELVTYEYPYSECSHPAQIYKKVISGKKPDALYRVKDPEVRQFIEKCLATVSLRLSAKEVLDDPFLQFDGESSLRSIMNSLPRDPSFELDHEEILSCGNNGSFNEYSKTVSFEICGGLKQDLAKIEHSGLELFEYASGELEEHLNNMGITIKGKRRGDGSIFLRLRISEDEERIRNIYFPFDIELDTALSVATEMVAELDITDQDVTKIADMIDEEIVSLVPEWKPGPGFMETPRFSKSSHCQSCASENSSAGSFLNFLNNNDSVSKNLKILQCEGNGCPAMHGRFEEITYKIDSPRVNNSTSVNSNRINQIEVWDNHDSLELVLGLGQSYSDGEHEKLDRIISTNGKIKVKETERKNRGKKFMKSLRSFKAISCFTNDFSEKFENENQQEMRWVRAKYHMELRDVTDQNLRKRPPKSPAVKKVINGISPLSVSNPFQGEIISKSLSRKKKSGSRLSRKSSLPLSESFRTKSLVPNPLHRSESLPVDAVDL